MVVHFHPHAQKRMEERGTTKKEKVIHDTPDLILLDVMMPKMGGKDAIKKLLKIDPELRAIVFSGYSDDPVMANFKEYGFRGMLPKPFESRSLGKVLHDVLKGEKE